MQKTIIAIDDSVEILNTIEGLLSTHGCEVLKADKPEDGLKLISEKKPNIDLIILDLVMPNTDGFAVLEEIRQNDETSHIPVIMLTSKAEMGVVSRAASLGVSDYLIKPIREDLFFSKIKKTFNVD